MRNRATQKIKKQMLFSFLLLVFSFTFSYSQELGPRFRITILDSAQLVTINYVEGIVVPVFRNSTINDTLNNYQINTFQRAFPYSRLRYLRDVWLFEADTSLMHALIQADSTLFAGAEIIKNPIPLHTPNDYSFATDGQKNLDLIRAKEAWDISKGSSNVIIGVIDYDYDLLHEDLSYNRIKPFSFFCIGHVC